MKLKEALAFSHLLLVPEICAYGGERWSETLLPSPQTFPFSVKFPVVHCATITLELSLVILRTWPAPCSTPSSHHHVCSFFFFFYRLGDLQTQPWPQRIKYSPGKTPAHLQSGILVCRLHCDCAAWGVSVCVRESNTEGDLVCGCIVFPWACISECAAFVCVVNTRCP